MAVAQPLTPLLTVEQFKSWNIGVHYDETDPEIYHAIQTAQALMDEYATGIGGAVLFQTKYDEIHKYRVDKSWEGGIKLRLRRRPVRIVQSIQILLGTFLGGRVAPTFATTPDETTAQQQPVIQGNVIVNRDSSYITVVGPTVIYAPPGLPGMFNAPLSVTYTMGFDAGSDPGDGMVYPAPVWMTEAVRRTTAKLLFDRRRGKSGRVARGQYAVGDMSVNFPDEGTDSLPQSVKDSIQRQLEHVVIGHS